MSIGRKQRQKVAFGAGVDRTRLTDPDTGSVDRTFAGVVGESGESQKILQRGIAAGAEGVSDIIKLGKKFHDKKVVGEARDKQSELLDEYLPDQDLIDSEFKELGIQNRVAQELEDKRSAMQQEHIFNKEQETGSGEAMTTAIHLAQKNVSDQISKLALAKTQGRISAEEFLKRSARLTRTAVANNPSLEREILEDTKRLWEVAGVRDRLRLDEKAATEERMEITRQRVQMNATYVELVSKDIPTLDDGSNNWPLMEQQIAEKQVKLKALQDITELAEDESREVETTVDEMTRPAYKGGPSKLEHSQDVGISLWVQTSQDSIRLIDSLPAVQKKEALRNTYADIFAQGEILKQEAHAKLEHLKGDKKGHIKEFLTRLDQRIDGYKTMLEANLSGEDVAKSLKNIQGFEEYDMMRKLEKESGIPIARVKLALQLAAIMPTHKWIKEFPNMHIAMTAMAGATMKTIDKQAGDPPPPDMSGKENQIAIDEVTLAAGVAADRNDKSESDRVNATTPEMIRIVNRGVSLQIESIKQSGGMLKQYERMDTLFDRWGDPQFTGGAKMLDPDVRNEANHTAKASLSILDSNMRKDMQEARENGIPINVSMDNGEVSFDTDKFTYPKVTNTSEAVKSVNELTGRSSYVRGLTSKVSRRVRKARRALANINGWKGDDPRLDKLIQKYMPNLSQELDNNEKGIVTPTIDKDQQARDKAEEQKQNYNTFEEEPNEKKKDSSEDVIVEELTDEVREEIKNHPWYEAFKKKEGYYPDLNTNQFRYQAAWEDGMRPEIGKDGDYHWGSKLIDGSDTKVNGHKTIYKNEISEEYGEEMVAYLDEKGITNREEAMKLIEIIKTTPSIYVKNNNKDLGYGVRNDPTQGYKGKGFAAGKHTVTMEDGEEVQVTEYTVGVEIDGKIVDVPSVNGYTTEEDMKAILESVRTGKPLPQEIEEKAQRHALDRIDAGKSIYLEDGEEQVPFAIDKEGNAEEVSELYSTSFTKRPQVGASVILGNRSNDNNARENLRKFIKAVHLIESNGGKDLYNKSSTAAGDFQFKRLTRDKKKKGSAFQTGLQRVINLYTDENKVIPSWVKEAKKHNDPRKLTYSQQEELFLINLQKQLGSDEFLQAMLDGDMYKAMELYGKYHHTNIKVIQNKEVIRKFNEAYETNKGK